jgi:hypothetical protein
MVRSLNSAALDRLVRIAEASPAIDDADWRYGAISKRLRMTLTLAGVGESLQQCGRQGYPPV